MVAPNGDRSHNSSSRYPTIERSEAFDVQTPSGGLVRNLNPDFNAVWVQAIMETIQRMASGARLWQLDAQEAAGLASRSAQVARELCSGWSERPAWARPWLWCLDERRKWGKKDGGVLGLVSTEKMQQHWKQAAEKETEYDDMRAQLNKIKFKLF
jgi:hypothetical protein